MFCTSDCVGSVLIDCAVNVANVARDSVPVADDHDDAAGSNPAIAAVFAAMFELFDEIARLLAVIAAALTSMAVVLAVIAAVFAEIADAFVAIFDELSAILTVFALINPRFSPNASSIVAAVDSVDTATTSENMI